MDDPFQITMVIENTGPCDISCDSIWLTLTNCASNTFTETELRLQKLKTPVTRQASNSSLDNRPVRNLQRVKSQVPSALDLCMHYEGNPDDPVLTGIACTNSHEVLTRNDSSGGLLIPTGTDEKVNKDTFNQSVCLNDFVLNLGTNTLQLECKVCLHLLVLLS